MTAPLAGPVRLPYVIAIVWLVFTVSLAAWWLLVGLTLAGDLRDADLAHQVAHQRAQPREHVLLREQLDLLGQRHGAVEGDHVREPRGIVEAIEDLRGLVGDVVAQADQLLGQALHRAARGLGLGVRSSRSGRTSVSAS